MAAPELISAVLSQKIAPEIYLKVDRRKFDDVL